jgi:hypothetical protein
MNPRRIPECVDAIADLSIDKVWAKNYTERELVGVIAGIIADSDYDPIGIISDDARPDQAALDLVLDAYKPGAVYTGYCNLSEQDYRVNLSTQPLTIQFEATMDCYTFITKDDLEAQPEALIRSWFAGHCFTFMSRDLWEAFPFGIVDSGNGNQSDYHLCCRLQESGVDIWAVRGAFVEHVKRYSNTGDDTAGRALLVGVEAAEVVWDLIPESLS